MVPVLLLLMWLLLFQNINHIFAVYKILADLSIGGPPYSRNPYHEQSTHLQVVSPLILPLPQLHTILQRDCCYRTQCPMLSVENGEGSNNPTCGQMHQQEVTHVRHHKRPMGQHVVTELIPIKPPYEKQEKLGSGVPTYLRPSILLFLQSS